MSKKYKMPRATTESTAARVFLLWVPLILFLIFLVTIIKDARYYARIDPMPRRKEEK